MTNTEAWKKENGTTGIICENESGKFRVSITRSGKHVASFNPTARLEDRENRSLFGLEIKIIGQNPELTGEWTHHADCTWSHDIRRNAASKFDFTKPGKIIRDMHAGQEMIIHAIFSGEKTGSRPPIAKFPLESFSTAVANMLKDLKGEERRTLIAAADPGWKGINHSMRQRMPKNQPWPEDQKVLDEEDAALDIEDPNRGIVRITGFEKIAFIDSRGDHGEVHIYPKGKIENQPWANVVRHFAAIESTTTFGLRIVRWGNSLEERTTQDGAFEGSVDLSKDGKIKIRLTEPTRFAKPERTWS